MCGIVCPNMGLGEWIFNCESDWILLTGRVGKLSIKIPWRKLGWDPIVIILEDVFVCASQRDDEEVKRKAMALASWHRFFGYGIVKYIAENLIKFTPFLVVEHGGGGEAGVCGKKGQTCCGGAGETVEAHVW